MDRERMKARQMVKELPFKEKVIHYWGYYKKHVLVFAVSVCVVAWSVVQCVTAPVYDMNIACYTSRFVEDECRDKFSEYLRDYVDEINGNETTDVFISMYSADITKNVLEPEEHAAYSKMTNELAADEYQTYIFDRPFLDYFERVYGETVQNVIPLHEIPEMKELWKIGDDEELFLVTTVMFNQSKDDEDKIAEHKNAEKIDSHFQELLEKQN